MSETVVDLQALRADIDALDIEIVALLCKRMQLAAGVAQYKIANNMPVFDSSREEALLAKIAALSGQEYAVYTREIYDTMLKVSKDYQSKLIAKQGGQA